MKTKHNRELDKLPLGARHFRSLTKTLLSAVGGMILALQFSQEGSLQTGEETMRSFLNAMSFVIAISSIGFLIAAERSYQHSFTGPEFAQTYRLS